MNVRGIAVVALAVALLGATSLVVAASGGSGIVSDSHEPNENASIQPGERLAGVVGVQGGELEGDLAERTFGLKVAQAASDEAKADVVAAQLNDNVDRLESIEERVDALQAQRDAGEISEGRFRAEIAAIAVEQQTFDRLMDRTEAAAADLPEALLLDRGINVEAINDLRDRAGDLDGLEVRDIARSIAGEGTGDPIGPTDGAPVDDDEGGAGPEMTDAEAMIGDAEGTIDEATQLVQEAEGTTLGSDDAEAALMDAKDLLENANASLAEAKTLLDQGDAEGALVAAQEALQYAEEALSKAEEALDLADGTPGSGMDGE